MPCPDTAPVTDAVPLAAPGAPDADAPMPRIMSCAMAKPMAIWAGMAAAALPSPPCPIDRPIWYFT